MIRPTTRLVSLCTVAVAVAILPAIVDGRLWTLWVGTVAALLLGAGLDALFGLSRRHLEVRVDPRSGLYVGNQGELLLHLSARRPPDAPVRLWLLVETDALLDPPAPVEVRLPRDGAVRVSIPLRPRRRGRAAIGPLWARWPGPLGLTARTIRRDETLAVPVLPDVKAVRDAAIRYFRTREFLVGQKTVRLVGDGSEFDSLREFQPGFDSRAMDWKASARHMRLLVREYRAERNNQIVLAFDTGRLMAEPLGGLPKLDRAINAALLLGYAALHTGDRVGLFSFGAEVGTWLAPRGGVGSFAALQGRTADLEYSAAETNFTLGLTTLLGRLSRRTLVVVFTDFVDTVTAELMIENLRRLAVRHLVLFVALRDPELTALADAVPEDLTVLHRAVVAADLLREREVVLRRLRRLGVHVLDVAVSQVSTSLVGEYLRIQRRELV